MSTTGVERERGRRVGGGEFAMVPESLLCNPLLSDAAVRLWSVCWMLIGRHGWILRKRDVCARIGFGDRTWSRATRELSAAGLYRLDRGRLPAGSVDERGRGTGGQAIVEHVFFWPGAVDSESGGSEKTAPTETGGRLPAPRPPGGLIQSKKTDLTIQRKRSSSRSRARARACAAASGVELLPKPPKPVAQTAVHGVTCWNDDDRATVRELLEAFDALDVEKAARGLLADGIDPLPSRVRDRLCAARSAGRPTTPAWFDRMAVARARLVERYRSGFYRERASRTEQAMDRMASEYELMMERYAEGDGPKMIAAAASEREARAAAREAERQRQYDEELAARAAALRLPGPQ